MTKKFTNLESQELIRKIEIELDKARIASPTTGNYLSDIIDGDRFSIPNNFTLTFVQFSDEYQYYVFEGVLNELTIESEFDEDIGEYVEFNITIKTKIWFLYDENFNFVDIDIRGANDE